MFVQTHPPISFPYMQFIRAIYVWYPESVVESSARSRMVEAQPFMKHGTHMFSLRVRLSRERWPFYIENCPGHPHVGVGYI